MITRRFGRTNLEMPVFSCGGMRYQHSWSDTSLADIPADSQKNLEASIERSLELGINHIETARGYGSSEVQLGQILPRFPRESLIVQTKIAPQPSAADFLKVFETSMSNLQLDFVDLLSIHGINNQELLEQTIRSGGSLDAARQLQREGRVRHIGFSTHGALPTILETLQTGEFDYVNLHWYWINQENWPAILEATRQDLGVFIISPNDKGGKLYEPPAKLVSLCEPFSPMLFNDLFCLSHPEVHTLSLGVSKPSDFEEHLKALPLLDNATQLVAPVVSKLEAEMEHILGREWLDSCFEGVPEWENVPAEINLRVILRLWNLDEALDMREYGIMRYNLLGQGEHWFPGHNATELHDADLLECLCHHPLRHKILAAVQQAHQRFLTAPKQRLSTSD